MCKKVLIDSTIKKTVDIKKVYITIGLYRKDWIGFILTRETSALVQPQAGQKKPKYLWIGHSGIGINLYKKLKYTKMPIIKNK